MVLNAAGRDAAEACALFQGDTVGHVDLKVELGVPSIRQCLPVEVIPHLAWEKIHQGRSRVGDVAGLGVGVELVGFCTQVSF